MLEGALLELVLIWLAVLLVTLGSKELALPEWDLEWLVTMPIPVRTLLGVRLLERTVVNAVGAVAFGPFLFFLAQRSGLGLWRWPLCLVAMFLLLGTVAVVQTLVDTALRLSVTAAALRNLQAILSILGIAAIYLAINLSTTPQRSFVMDWAAHLPAWTWHLPQGQAVRALTATDGAGVLRALAELALEAGLLMALGLAILVQRLERGIEKGGIRDAVRRVSMPSTAPATGGAFRWLLSPIQARELRLLTRDRTFLVQTLVLPVLVLGAQWVFNPGRESRTELLAHHPGTVAAAAFTVGAYGLIFSALQTLNAEGKALWVLYTFPRPLEAILREKATLWGFLCLVYPVLILAWGLHGAERSRLELLGLAGLVLVALPLYAIIATALGVFACDPLAADVQRRLKPSYVYLYMGLAGPFGYALSASGAWQRAIALLLILTLALALWQKARDHLPFLLDPAASPPARVSLADGVMAVVAFFIFQGIGIGIAGQVTGKSLTVAFAAAGALTYGVARLIFWRTQSQGVPALWSSNGARGLGLGVAAGLTAAAGAWAYLRWLVPLFTVDVPKELELGELGWLVGLAVVAAPLFEEFIFRGLVFGGLRRSMGALPAILASAALFALMHPPVAVLPVFGLGLCAAAVYERSRMLAAPMVAHATYNLAVIAMHGWR